MFEWLLPLALCLINSILGSWYADKFLKAKTSGNTAMFLWAFLSFVLESLMGEKIDAGTPFGILLKTAADMGIVLFLQLLLYQKDLSKQFFVTVSFIGGKKIVVYIVVVTVFGLNNASYEITNLLSQNGWIDSIEKAKRWMAVSNGLIWVVTILSYFLLLAVYLFVMASKFVNKEYRLQKHENAFLTLPSIASLCIAITLQMMILSTEQGVTELIFNKVGATLFWIPLICVLLLGVNVSSVILFQKMVQLNEEERKRSILENQIVQMRREIAEIQDIYADMRGLRHDMRSHLESIAAVLEKTQGKEREELDGYLGQMEETVERLDFSYRTGNAITDVILHQKKQEANKRGISFWADFTYPDQKQIDVYDIGIVLNNALENAIEAAGKAQGKKKIILRSYQKGSLFFIETENTFSGSLTIDKKTGLPVSTKEDVQFHGLGMENIKRCAGKYKGDIDIAIKEAQGEKIFLLTVMMYEKTRAAKTP